jgi:hypothetical protein
MKVWEDKKVSLSLIESREQPPSPGLIIRSQYVTDAEEVRPETSGKEARTAQQMRFYSEKARMYARLPRRQRDRQRCMRCGVAGKGSGMVGCAGSCRCGGSGVGRQARFLTGDS